MKFRFIELFQITTAPVIPTERSERRDLPIRKTADIP